MAGDSPAVIIFNVDGYNVDTILDAANQLGLHTANPFTIDREKLIIAEIVQENLVATEYFMFIDLDNGGGAYKHTAGPAAFLVGAAATAFKTKNNDSWEIEIGTILDINGTDATIGFLSLATLSVRSTSTFEDTGGGGTLFPVIIDTTVSGGDFTKIATSNKETVTDINTGVTIEDVGGNLVTPAIGDIIVRANLLSGGTGELFFNFSLIYFVE